MAMWLPLKLFLRVGVVAVRNMQIVGRLLGEGREMARRLPLPQHRHSGLIPGGKGVLGDVEGQLMIVRWLGHNKIITTFH